MQIDTGGKYLPMPRTHRPRNPVPAYTRGFAKSLRGEDSVLRVLSAATPSLMRFIRCNELSYLDPKKPQIAPQAAAQVTNKTK
jgi:hypothetical protein